MQDSLEDYIRLMNNTKQNTVGNLNTQEKTIPWETKQQYENYAFKIIEFMIEGRLQPQVFVKSLNFIQQEHYQDIVEERAVTKLCGYPVCGKQLPPMPKKQFHISTRQNKVYDITDRKLFCCNYCYQASEFIKKQIDITPLWSRSPEDFPRFILLDQNEILRPGIEVDHGLAKLPTDHNFTSINSFTEACLDEAEEMEYIKLMQEKAEEEKIPETKPKSILKKKKRVVCERIEEEDENPESIEESENARELERNFNNMRVDGEMKTNKVVENRKTVNWEDLKQLDGNCGFEKVEVQNPVLKEVGDKIGIQKIKSKNFGFKEFDVPVGFAKVKNKNSLKEFYFKKDKIQTHISEQPHVKIGLEGVRDAQSNQVETKTQPHVNIRLEGVQDVQSNQVETKTQESPDTNPEETCKTEQSKSSEKVIFGEKYKPKQSEKLSLEKLDVEGENRIEKSEELIVEGGEENKLQENMELILGKCTLDERMSAMYPENPQKSAELILEKNQAEEETFAKSITEVEAQKSEVLVLEANCTIDESSAIKSRIVDDCKTEISKHHVREDDKMEESIEFNPENLEFKESNIDNSAALSSLENLHLREKCKIEKFTKLIPDKSEIEEETNMEKSTGLNPENLRFEEDSKIEKQTELHSENESKIKEQTKINLEQILFEEKCRVVDNSEIEKQTDKFAELILENPTELHSENESKIEEQTKTNPEKLLLEEKCRMEDKTNLETYLEKLQVEAKCKIQKSAEVNVKKLEIKTQKSPTPPQDKSENINNTQFEKKVTVKPEYAEPSTSGRNTVRFKIDPYQNSYSHCQEHAKTQTNAISPIQGMNKNIPEEELVDFREYIQGICKSMGITPRSNQKPKEKPVEIDEAKMRLIIEKVNASEESRNKRVQLIETHRNPERTKLLMKHYPENVREIWANRFVEKVKIPEVDENLKVVIEKVNNLSRNENKEEGKLTKLEIRNRIEDEHLKRVNENVMPKYAHRIAEKVKTPDEDTNVKDVIEKVKSLNVNKNKEQDKLKEVLEKIKRKGGKPKGSIFINTSINPESVEVPKKKQPIKPVETSPALDKIRTHILQWLTLETYIFIHGDARIKRILNEDMLEGYFENLKIAELETTKQVKYMNICKKLKLREMAEEKFDGVLLKDYKRMKPLPDYGRLKEEGKDMDLKVKAFFTGSVYEKDDPNFKSKIGDGGVSGEESPAVLPLVDAGSQNVVRRRIFINAVTKYVQIHIKELELDESILIEVHNMIKTFKFEAYNIIFKPQMWNIIGYVLIMMISCKCDAVKSKLATANADTYRDLIFSKYCDGDDFLQQVFRTVESVEVYVKNYIILD